MDLCSVSDVRAFTPVRDELRVSDLIALVSAEFLAQTGATFTANADVEVILDSTGAHTLSLPFSPTNVTKVEVRPGRGMWTPVEVEWSGSGLLRTLEGTFPRGYRNVRVTASWGEDGVPSDLTAGIARAVARFMNTVPGRDSFTLGSFSVTFSQMGTSDEWATLVRKYQKR